MLADLIQLLIAAATAGTLYGLVAVGVTFIYSATGIINFAQGEFVMIGGMTMAALYGERQWPMAPAIGVALIAVAIYASVLMAVATRFGRGGSLISVLIITIGASIATSGAAARLWDADTHRFAPFSGDAPVVFVGAAATPQAFWIIGIGGLAIAAVWWFLRFTLWGKAVQACASDGQAASMMGISVRRSVLLTFVLSGTLGCIGGIVATPLTTIDYNSGMLLAIKGFAAAMLGGMGNITGAIVGAFLIALLEALAVTYVSSSLKELVTFTVVIGVLLWLPQGLLGGRGESGLQHDDHLSA